jgi:ribosomal protein S18 acetylase RimI-like enzyme
MRGEKFMKTDVIKIAVIRADKLNFDVRTQMASIFADGFTQWLGYFSKDRNTIAKAFAHMFVLDQFFVAVIDDKIAGMAACTDCITLSLRLNIKELRKHLGFIKGSIAGVVLKKEFESPFNNPALETGSIEFVGTATEFRGKGVATKIINYIISNTTYRNYLIEEVADTNTPAINLYKKLGFQEYRRIPVPQKKAEKIGINNFISLKYIK